MRKVLNLFLIIFSLFFFSNAIADSNAEGSKNFVEKLGKEVERLVEGGEIHHPGLVRGVHRIAELHKRIESAQTQELHSDPEK